MKLDGDARRGGELFANAAGLQCKSCHNTNGSGARVGPDLRETAKKYTRAQLLESILQPSKSVDPKFQTHVVATADGRILTGVVTSRTERGLTLRDAKDQEHVLQSADIELDKVQSQSLMPDQLLRDLTPQQAADLLSYLESLR